MVLLSLYLKNIVMRKSCVAVFMLLLFIQACDEKKVEDSFTLNFKAKFENQALQTGKEFTDASGKKWKIDDLNFYFSNLRLVKQDGTETALKDLGYISFKDAKTTSIKFSDIPLGKYTGIKFNAGLTPAQNDVNPNFLDDNDVRLNATYWEWAKYVFVRLEGRADLTGGTKFETLLVYHIGTNDLLREVSINATFDVAAGDFQKNILIELDKVFSLAPGLDIAVYEQSYTHADPKVDKNYPTAVIFADNFSKSFSLE
jgi:hypothetical protein